MNLLLFYGYILKTGLNIEVVFDTRLSLSEVLLYLFLFHGSLV